MATEERQEILEQIEQHLEKADLAWLLGAGVSFDANIPLMYPLTERIAYLLQAEDQPGFEIYTALRENLPDGAHVEHVLSHLGDIISLTDRSKDNKIRLDDTELEKKNLEALYQSIVKHIRTTIRFGFKKRVDGAADSVGTSETPLVNISQHREFVRSIFKVSRAGVENRREGVRFFTLNYDTLLEDALSFERVNCVDGFTGGAIGFWNPENFNSRNSGNEAAVVKLHGSIDWRFDEQKSLIKCRENIHENDNFADVLIYPQQTKYIAAQKDPFSVLFRQFRQQLNTTKDQALAICGYSFGDDHVNLEIETALGQSGNNTTLICFVQEPRDAQAQNPELPKVLHEWLTDKPWSERIFVLTDCGLYWGSTTNRFEPVGGFHDWWTFAGVSNLLVNGI